MRTLPLVVLFAGCVSAPSNVNAPVLWLDSTDEMTAFLTGTEPQPY